MVSFSKNLWSSVKIKFLQKTAALYDNQILNFTEILLR
ncbi:hypothetical protein LEP1GSC034_4119 [Leptospira interrogans str. 2003000735]|uniref:Uncharacterized protein n=6 Tax=Leptospira interrogans TaxID=173 RepID=M6ZS50_LEPIR|nr:hypothetical protein G436_4071 [Leptospira interrogans serovar Hardjo str. Norma]EJP18175.1 hypothetical protein LEP1GSC080_4615 [Leptospira interrogans str. FPW2026]EKN89721.1 hypothetical protein LEP1GSC027_4012 [Leptospira interrogans str. 2002000624]EKO06553.1 hypothetical protein LEP1GSC077_2019 [Leptospira interrogans str. C10069]EKO25762.1 hypothetical protein LEP1GSC104_4727 [Leptospira interrogans str. UI 12621]EKO97742.1 hypothetical protein LEP1GSC057_2726 [Leptospira interrogans